nr:hypothetical protein [Niallia taxi]
MPIQSGAKVQLVEILGYRSLQEGVNDVAAVYSGIKVCGKPG